MNSPLDAPDPELRRTRPTAPPHNATPLRPEVAWDEAERVLALVSGKWVLRILQVLDARGALRHNHLLREMGKTVSARSLDATLRRMEDAGLVNRQVDPGTPPAVSYELTSLARSLIVPIAVLGRWGTAHHRELRTPRQRGPEDPAE